MTRREVILLAGVAAGAGVGGALLGALALQSSGGAAELLGTRFVDLSGQPRRLLDWRGRALICNFWATWCAPCREEIPLLVAAKQQLPANAVDIVGIGIDEAAKLREFALNFGINYPILRGGVETLPLIRKLGNRAGGLPYNVVLDRHGVLVHQKLGALTAEELRQLIDGFLQ